MQSSQSKFDVNNFKDLFDEVPTDANGWVLDYDGVARKDHPESSMKVFKKLMEGESVVTVRCECYFKGLKAGNLFKMLQDIPTRLTWDPLPKILTLIEKPNANSDVIYQEVPLPFPMSDRDFVQERFYLDSKKDAGLVKELGLFNFTHQYYILMVKSVERSEYPAKDKPVRGETKMTYWLLQEDPNDKDSMRLFVLMCQDLKGMIPTMLVNKLAGSAPHKVIGAVLDNYPKIFGK